jgi:hypothetical protein
MKRSHIAWVSVLILVALIAGCAKGKAPSDAKAVKQTLSETPKWYDKPPRDDDHLYAASTATSQDLQMAVDKAKQDAMVNLGTQFEANVRGLFQRFQEETGLAGDSQFIEESTRTSEVLVDEVLIGVREKDKAMKQEGNTYRAYILMELPIGEANLALAERLRQNEYLYTRVRATEAYKELERKIEEHRAQQ